jgi:hypothetical protein
MFEPYLTWANALKRAQHPVSALVTAPRRGERRVDHE